MVGWAGSDEKDYVVGKSTWHKWCKVKTRTKFTRGRSRWVKENIRRTKAFMERNRSNT